jgi:uncharacterized membrane protein (Fun14 family)
MIKKIFLMVSALFLLTNCGAIDKSIKHRKLEVQTKMSETIFLDPVSEDKKTVFLQMRNTSDKKDLDIFNEIKSSIECRGYKIVSDVSKAHFMIQANILQVGKSTDEDPFSSLSSGFGGALVGSTAASIASGNNGYGSGVAMGGLVGGMIGYAVDAAVQVVHYRIITDLQVSEKACGVVVNESTDASLSQGRNNLKSSWNEKSQWKRYQTRIISVAKKVNLKFEDALPELKRGLVQSISGLL